jgi:uncharacterized repeat protein (TIGR03803 family)
MFDLKDSLKRVLINILVGGLVSGSATLAVAQSETILHTFTTNSSGGFPASSGFAADATGALYGVAMNGGSCANNSGCGVAYKLTPPAGAGGWTQTVLYDFAGIPDAALPQGNLLIDATKHAVYGTSIYGGIDDNGTVFALTPGHPWTETVIHKFTGADGSAPSSGVVMYKGNLFGTAGGGPGGYGVIFHLRPPSTAGGAWEEQTLHSFDLDDNGGFLLAAPVFDAAGNMYGTTFSGATVAGTVYRLVPPVGGVGAWTLSTLYAFTGGIDGGSPLCSLVFDNAGALYGTAEDGGDFNNGTVFKLTPPSGGTGAWTESVIYSFTGGADGAIPIAGVTFDSVGNLYGVVGGGGNLGFCGGFGCGAVFKLTGSGSGETWTESVVYGFEGGNDGNEPYSNLLLLNGSLYGTTLLGGGTNGDGIAFQVTP